MNGKLEKDYIQWEFMKVQIRFRWKCSIHIESSSRNLSTAAQSTLFFSDFKLRGFLRRRPQTVFN